MMKYTTLVLVALAISVANAAPSEINSKQEDPVLDLSLRDTDKGTIDELTKSSEQPSVRKKRWYSFQGLGYPPMSPIAYPSFTREDQSPFISPELQLFQIHNRLRDLTSQIQQLHARQLTTALFPVIIVPVNCGCTSSQPKPPPAPGNESNSTDNPDITNRFPELDDVNQNWGLFLDGPEDNTDYSRRPLNFNPIIPETPLRRVPPPVEHGSSQADVNAPSPAPQRPAHSSAPASPPQPQPEASTQGPLAAPSTCDSAILACCRLSPLFYNCFSNQGCPNPEIYGNPCSKQVIKQVLDRFSNFYMRNNV